MKRALACFVFILAAATIGIAQAPKEKSPQKEDEPPALHPMTPVVHVKVRANPVQPPALKYRLMPELLERTPGNAAVLWLRAGRIAGSGLPIGKGDDWESREFPLKDLPRSKIRQLLEKYTDALRFAERAALREYCNWDLEISGQKEIKSVLEEIQMFRTVARLLKIRIRLALAEGRYAEAIHDLRIGFVLAKHLGEGPSLLHFLVGVALGSVMLGEVEEMLELPAAPNLYWGLTVLRQPFIDLAKALQGEMGWQDRTFPHLLEFLKADITAENAQSFIGSVLHDYHDWVKQQFPVGQPKAPPPDQAEINQFIETIFAEARATLISGRRTAKDIDAMPRAQVVALYLQSQYSQYFQEVLKWAFVPYWQGYHGLSETAKRFKASKNDPIGALLALGTVQAMKKVHTAWGRIERQIAVLRCVEAIRLYAATHDGKLPEALSDITQVPLPIDPATGRGFDSFYKVYGSKAVLDVPPLPAMIPPPPDLPAPNMSKRYEFSRAQ